MAAAYATGVSTSPTDLLNTIAAFLVTQGWTSDSLANESSGRRFHAHKNGQYVNMRAAENESIWPNAGTGNYAAGYGIGFNLATGYSGAAAVFMQSGRPIAYNSSGASPTASPGVGVGMRLPSGSIVGYHLFDDGNDHVTVVAEITPGKYQYLAWGPSLAKRGYAWDAWYFTGSVPGFYATNNPIANAWGFTGGDHACWPMGSVAPAGQNTSLNQNNHNACAYVRLDSAVYADRWISGMCNQIASNSQAIGNTGRLLVPSVVSAAVTFNVPSYNPGGAFAEGDNTRGSGKCLYTSAYTRALLVPLNQYYLDPATGRYVHLGHPPTLFRFAGLDPGNTGFSAGQVLAIGGVDYKLFPRFAVLKGA